MPWTGSLLGAARVHATRTFEAAKAALTTYSKELANQFAPHGIRVPG
jgi:NAD(P)-dependent dehydrogenase (short-subunit alcohol dehydrogenase family)